MRKILLLGLLLFSFSTLFAQEDGWRAVYFNPTEEGGELVVIGEEGYLETLALPEEVYEPAREASLATEFVLSPDLRYLVVNYGRTSTESGEARSLIYDLTNDTHVEIEPEEGYAQILRGFTFNPEGTRLAVVFLVTESAAGTRGSAGVMTINPTNGDIDGQINVNQLNEAVESVNEDIWLYVGGWFEQGIEMTPACLNCDGIRPAPFWYWNPETGDIHESPAYFSFGTRLSTGEVVSTQLDDRYPSKEDQDAYLPPANVVKYYPPGVNPEETDGRVVYFNDDNLPLGGVIWGMNGDAFFTRQQGEAEGAFVLRGGTILTAAMPKGPMIVTGTPDGWLLIAQDGRMYDARMVNGEIVLKEVFQLALSDDFDLGALGNGGVILIPRLRPQSTEVFPEVRLP